MKDKKWKKKLKQDIVSNMITYFEAIKQQL